jgi:hypothetical protein
MEDKKGLSMRIAWVISIFVLLFTVGTCGWASEDGQGQKTISGSIEDIDWVKSMITVRYSDPYSGNTDEIDIIVPSDTKIMNGTEQKYLSDLEQSDMVTVTYYNDGLSGLKAKRITDLNAGNMDS